MRNIAIYVGHLTACYWQSVIMDATMGWTCRLNGGERNVNIYTIDTTCLKVWKDAIKFRQILNNPFLTVRGEWNYIRLYPVTNIHVVMLSNLILICVQYIWGSSTVELVNFLHAIRPITNTLMVKVSQVVILCACVSDMYSNGMAPLQIWCGT